MAKMPITSKPTRYKHVVEYFGKEISGNAYAIKLIEFLKTPHAPQ